MSTATTDLPHRFTQPDALRAWSDACRRDGLTVGFVPTMGALHAGHRSLIERALGECDRVAVSIFVNPAQFGPSEDFSRYPRPLEKDIELLRAAGAHAVFIPSVETMYPEGASTKVHAGGALTTSLEGAARPGHFDGVALVVTKLINAARPDRIYFGQKDAQQVAVVRRVIADLDLGCQMVVCPVVRDADGVALSSRNAYLDDAARGLARRIPEGLSLAAEAFAAGERSAAVLTGLAKDRLSRPGIEIGYVAAVDPVTFQPVETAAVKTEILIAVRIGNVRLIDVLSLGEDAPPVSQRTEVAAEGESPDVAGARG